MQRIQFNHTILVGPRWKIVVVAFTNYSSNLILFSYQVIIRRDATTNVKEIRKMNRLKTDSGYGLISK